MKRCPTLAMPPTTSLSVPHYSTGRRSTALNDDRGKGGETYNHLRSPVLISILDSQDGPLLWYQYQSQVLDRHSFKDEYSLVEHQY